MKIAVAKSGAPVLRFVECRHYPKEHRKLVQTSISADGYAVLRFMPGDYCLFGSETVVSVAETKLGPNAGSVLEMKRQVGAETPQARSNPLNELLSPYQRYACEKFGPACPVALAIQTAENPQGACEIYHYNSTNGTLDWGFFQINTVHLTRRGLNLRDLLDCRTNIDFAYQLFQKRGFEPWTTYIDGTYRKFLGHYRIRLTASMATRRASIPFAFSR